MGETIMELHKPIRPMLLEKSEKPPTGTWINQLKLDGIRTIFSFQKGKGVKLFTKNENEMTEQFHEFNLDLPVNNIILDGETIVLHEGKPDIEKALKRLKSRKSLHPSLPANLLFFDILLLNDRPLTALPLTNRLEILQSIELPEPLGICPSHPDGEELFEATKNLGLEGYCAKKPNSRYVFRRSKNWLKIKHYTLTPAHLIAFRTNPFRILVQYGDQHAVLQYIQPNVKTFIQSLAEPNPIHHRNGWTMLKNELPCEIKHQGFTSSGALRSATFNRFLF